MSKTFIESYQDYGINVLVDPYDLNNTYAICPKCTPDRKPEHQKEKKLAVKNGYWRCNHCGWSGHLLTKEYAQKHKKIKTINKSVSVELNDKIVNWFWNKRRIRSTTLRKCNVFTTKHSIFQGKNKNPLEKGKFVNVDCIAFVSKIGKDIVNIKYRDSRKNFQLEKNADLVFYGLNDIEYTSTAIIVEGEIDKLTFAEAGFMNCISVPNGATVSPIEAAHYKKYGTIPHGKHLNLSYLDKCYEWLEDKEIIYIGTDNDAAGYKLRMELIRRLGKEKCRILNYGKYKDVNEVLTGSKTYDEGIKQIKKIIEDAVPLPIEDVIMVKDVDYECEQSYDVGMMKGLTLGFKSIGKHIMIKEGQLIAINGYPGMGKTSFIFAVIVVYMAVKYGWKFAIYSPENYPVELSVNMLAQIYIGNTMDKEINNRMTKTEYLKARHFLNKYVYFINNKDGYTPEQLRSVQASMVKMYGINACITDPWNSLIHRTKENLDTYLETELSAEQRFATNYKICKIISAHPPTPKDPDKGLRVPMPSQIRGGTIWWNKTYLMICIHIIDMDDINDTSVEIHVQKAKIHNIDGFPTKRNSPIQLFYNRRTGRYMEMINKNKIISPLNDLLNDLSGQEEINFDNI